MTGRGLGALLMGWAAMTLAACWCIHRAFALELDEAHPTVVVASVWSAGLTVGRAILRPEDDARRALATALSSSPDATLVSEKVIGDGPLVTWPEAAFALSFVAGHDGLAGTIRGRTDYVTPDELLAHQAYDRGLGISSLGVSLGVDGPVALSLLADRLGVTVGALLAEGHLRRVRVVRATPSSSPRIAVAMTDYDVMQAVIAAARFLARGVDSDGRFRYLIDAPTNRTLAGYDFPRHAGATYFLAQAAALSGDATLAWAALRAAGWLREGALGACGPNLCIGSDSIVDVGSTALTVIAFVEIARTKLDPAYALLVPRLTAFLRAQQRPDGEFMHQYDRARRRAVDVQLLYYSGEAALALSRAHSLLGDAADLDAARRAVAYLVGPGWSFFGSRYYFGEEHWTCQAMDDLWDRAPDARALDFCVRWQEYNRTLQYEGEGDTPFDRDGAYGLGPMMTPRFTPVASRTEAGIATLDAARRWGLPAPRLAALEAQLRRSIGLLLRQQFRPGARHLFADPSAVDGAMPGSEVDWELRIDYTQHMGSALVRWLGLGAR
jgi:hypothetical protein